MRRRINLLPVSSQILPRVLWSAETGSDISTGAVVRPRNPHINTRDVIERADRDRHIEQGCNIED